MLENGDELLQEHIKGKCLDDCGFCNEDWSWFIGDYRRGAALIFNANGGYCAYSARHSEVMGGYLHCSKARFMSMMSLPFEFRLNCLLDYLTHKAKLKLREQQKSGE